MSSQAPALTFKSGESISSSIKDKAQDVSGLSGEVITDSPLSGIVIENRDVSLNYPPVVPRIIFDRYWFGYFWRQHDFNNDGHLDLMAPQLGFSDGNSSTIEGSIVLRNVNASNISALSPLILQPWSLPTSLITMDMDGDGVLEHIVSAGELSHGVFIGGWHTIGLDADSDGTPEITSTGYAGDSSNGLPPLMMVDENSILKGNLSGTIPSQPTLRSDFYGIVMTNLSMNLSSTGLGQVNYSGLDIGYDCVFVIEENPSLVLNLTNSLKVLT